MKKLVALVAGVAVLCGMTAFAQHKPGAATEGPGAVEEQIGHAHQMAGLLLRAVHEGEHDATTWPLVTKALTDRTTLLQAELDRVSKMQALITALQGGDKNAIQSARQDVKAATEAVGAAAKTFVEDASAVRDHLKPEHGAKPGATTAPATTK